MVTASRFRAVQRHNDLTEADSLKLINTGHMNAPKPTLLMIDDDSQLSEMMTEYLEKQGFVVNTARSGEAGLAALEELQPDLIVLDVMLPGIDGFKVLENIREKYNLPVIMLTARGEESDRILGLMRGADDYLPKPFNPLELTVRIQAVLKRASGSRSQAEENEQDLIAGPLLLNLQRCTAEANGIALTLTAAELRVLEQLMRHPGEVMSKAKLTELALDRPFEAFDRSIDTLISRLRGKFSDAGLRKDIIKNLRGHGYVLDHEELQ